MANKQEKDKLDPKLLCIYMKIGVDLEWIGRQYIIDYQHPLIPDKNKYSKSLRSQILEIQQKRAIEKDMTEIDFSAILKDIEALEHRENDEFERNKNEEDMLNSDYYAIAVAVNAIKGDPTDSQLERMCAAAIIQMKQSGNRIDQKWIESPYAEYLRYSILLILKMRARTGDNRPHNFSVILLDIDKLQYRELEEYHRHKNEMEILRKNSLAIKKVIDATIEPDAVIQQNSTIISRQNEPMIATELNSTNVEHENDDIQWDMVD